jgi:peptidoglycan/LPS O-acetylase OafA/YrhL
MRRSIVGIARWTPPSLWAASAAGHLWLLASNLGDQSWKQVAALALAIAFSALFAVFHRRIFRHPLIGLAVAALIFASHPTGDATTATQAVAFALASASLLLGALAGLSSSERSRPTRRQLSLVSLLLALPREPSHWPHALSRPPPFPA